MEQQEKYLWLNEYLDALQKSLGFMDLSTLQPTSWRHFQPLIAKEWIDWFWNILEEAEKQNKDYADIAKCLEPDLCREHLLFILEDLKTARLPLGKRLKIVDFFYSVLKVQMPHGDLFGLHGTTKMHTNAEISEIISCDFNVGNVEVAREFGKLYNGAYNLGAALYLDFYMGKAIENWGPYHISDKQILVIKEMRFLKPVEIWPEIGTMCEKIDLYVIYEDVEFSTDLIACHTQYTGDVINGLKKWRLVVDGKVVNDLEIIRQITKNFAVEGSKQWTNLMSLSEQEIIKKAVEIRCFCFNKVCDLLSMDWRPTQNLFDIIKGKTLSDGWIRWKQFDNEAEYNEYWRKIWDPREEFYN